MRSDGYDRGSLWAQHSKWAVCVAGALLLCLAILQAAPTQKEGARKPRIIATTDGEIDDRCSMVRFLLYANEWDIEGIIISSSKFHWKGHNWAGEKWIDEDIDLYAQSYDNLKQHDPDFPTPQALKKLIYVGNIDNVGEMGKDTPGSDRIVDILLDDEPGPVYLQAWGGTNTIARALWKIQREYPGKMKKVSKKAIIYIILDQDTTFREYIQPNWPDLMVLGSFRQFATIAYRWDSIIPPAQRKYYDANWMNANILQEHGPLCSSYEAHGDGKFRSEGDSPAFMHQILVGLGSLEDPTYGGWGGRFVREEGTRNVWRGAQDDGSWSKPIWRWSEDFQNDWAARADWCVKSYDKANHNPKAVVNGVDGREIVRIQAKPGSSVKLSAAGSSDPDGDRLSYKWWYYAEPSTFADEVTIGNADAEKAIVKVPYDNQANEFHIILIVRDNGSPNLFAYRRVVVSSPGVLDDTAPSAPTRLKVTGVTETQVSWIWQAAGDQESGIRRYVMYRDGTCVGESKSTRFTDSGLRESTRYTYQISAVNGSSMEGEKSARVQITTAPDKTPPAIGTVAGIGGKIRVVFSEPVEHSSAQNASNYAIDRDVSISAATLASDQQSVTLTPSAMTDGVAYTLSVRNIRDQAKVPNTLTSSRVPFTYRVTGPLVCIGITDGESPVKFRGEVKQEKDGSLFFADGEPWRWVTAGVNEKPLKALEGLKSFTILGWAKATSLRTGSGGNRLVFNLRYNRSGMDLVHHGDGRLRLAVNEWPDGVSNDSSPGKIKVGKWVFFAVSYDSSKTQNTVHWYFGDEATPAQLDRTTNYSRGPTGTDSGPLTVGNYNTTIHRHGKDRQFRGWLRGITIFGSRTDSSGVLDLDTIRVHQRTPA
ncbi:MAG: DUF1593 domain-containing protein [Phycisphaerales bacterium]|nr:MAG: DUF1593 domain-containing protein [Phycisphaerales bacterium]